MTISEMEDAYQQLRGQLLIGELDEEEFKSEVERLRFEDDLGRRWKIGWYTGKWYRYDQGQWVQGRPREPQPSEKEVLVATSLPATDRERTRRPLPSLLIVALIVLLLLAGGALSVGWVSGWWNPSTRDAMAQATPTSSEASRPTTVAVSSTSTTQPLPQAAGTATRTPRPTAAQPGTTVKAVQTEIASPTDRETAAALPTSSPTDSPTPSATAVGSPTSSSELPSSSVPSLSGRIFFPVYDPDPERQTFDIHAVQLETGEREIAVEQASQPALSPNGKRLAHRSWNSAQRSIRVLELSDGGIWEWIKFAEAGRPSWAPDSENIVFASQQESDRQWRVYRTFGLEFDRIRSERGDILGRVPVWLADGRIVYWECPLDKCGLYVMQNTGAQSIRLTDDEQDTAPAASPDGRQVTFMSDRDGNWEIYIVSTETAGGQGGQELVRLTRNNARDGLPTFSPDGEWLAFVSDRGGDWAVWVMRPDGSGQQKLFDLGGSLEGKIALVPPGDQSGWTWETIVWAP